MEKEEKYKSFFEEYEIIVDLIQSIEDETNIEKFPEISKKIIDIINRYQECPQLLDPHLEEFVKKLTSIARNVCLIKSETKYSISCRKYVFKILYILSKVRGYKILLKRFPHNVADLEPLWDNLDLSSVPEFEWETRYVLLLWLSLIVMNPFTLEFVISNEKKKKIIADCVEKGFSIAGKVGEGYCLFLSRLLTQPDMKNECCEFFEWIIRKYEENLKKSFGRNFLFIQIHILDTLSKILVFGRREDILLLGKDGKYFIERFFPDFLKKFIASLCDFQKNNNSLLRKFAVKVTQRVGLLFLKPKIVSWRYKKARRVLLQRKEKKKNDGNEESDSTDQLEIDQENESSLCVKKYRKEIEFVISQLISGLTDKDTVVRWSSAKGIGRLTFRLPQSFADEIVKRIIGMFSRKLSSVSEEYRLHGGCLALAELSRRGLLLPKRLGEVISEDVLLRAMTYDELHGRMKCSSGQNVRDASCYVCWSFGRAYESEVLRPYLRKRVFPVLLSLAVFDREINVRRAAAAAFQENVGRHEWALQRDSENMEETEKRKVLLLIEKVNYFALSNLKRCYLEVSLDVVDQNPDEYLVHFVKYLVNKKIGYWDQNIREHASKILSILVVKYLKRNNTGANETIKKIFLEPVIEKAVDSFDLNLRHGCLITIAEFLFQLKKEIKVGSNFLETINAGMSNSIVDVIPSVVDRNPICEPEETGYTMIQDALCYLIQCISEYGFIELPKIFKVPKRSEEVDSSDEDESEGEDESDEDNEIEIIGVHYIQEILDNNLKRSGENVSNFALDSFFAFVRRYYMSFPNDFLVEVVEKKYLLELENGDKTNTVHKYSKRGYVLALGQVDPELLLKSSNGRKWFLKILVGISKHIKPYSLDPKKKSENDVESRKNSVIGFSKFCERCYESFVVGFEKEMIDNKNLLDFIFSCLADGIEDYLVDRRGDVGSWVREVSMTSIRTLILLFFGSSKKLDINNLSISTKERIVGLLMKQGVEKIDKLRRIAWNVLVDIQSLLKLPALTEFLDGCELDKLLKDKAEKSSKKEEIEEIDMMLEEEVFDLEFIFSKFLLGLRIPSFKFPLVEGLMLSLGSKFPKKEFKKEFTEFLKKEGKVIKEIIFSCSLEIFKSNKKKNRITIPLLSFLNIIIQEMDEMEVEDVELAKKFFDATFFQLVFSEVDKTKAISKISNAISLCATLLMFYDIRNIRKSCIRFLVRIGLKSSFPRIRQHCSNVFYVALQTYGEDFIDDDEDLDELMDCLGESDWLNEGFGSFLEIMVPILKKYLG